MAAHALAPVVSTDPDDFGLPGWIYHDPEFYRLEMERVIRPSWQIICHVSDIPAPGDYETIDMLGESIVVIRGADRVVRGFSNVCRHRAMKIVEGAGCTRKLVCPYHAWTYELDGRLSGVPMRGDYPALDMGENGLLTVDCEIWNGFVFVRLGGDGGPSVATMMVPADGEVSPYRIADMVPLGTASARPRRVNWKNVGDNYSDNLHIPVAHGGLTRLFGKSYAISAHGWVDKMSGQLADAPGANFWERFYQRHLPRNPHLPEAQQRLWLYFKLWPNMAFDLYADQIDFMHWLPTGPTTTELRVRSYALPDDRREMRLVRYANDRINRTVNAEDTWLIERVQAGMQSRGNTAGPIATSEVCLRNFAGRLRTLIPEARLPHAPPPGWSQNR
jgi:carnitine monooxygenase subunit